MVNSIQVPGSNAIEMNHKVAVAAPKNIMTCLHLGEYIIEWKDEQKAIIKVVHVRKIDPKLVDYTWYHYYPTEEQKQMIQTIENVAKAGLFDRAQAKSEAEKQTWKDRKKQCHNLEVLIRNSLSQPPSGSPGGWTFCPEEDWYLGINLEKDRKEQLVREHEQKMKDKQTHDKMAASTGQGSQCTPQGLGDRLTSSSAPASSSAMSSQVDAKVAAVSKEQQQKSQTELKQKEGINESYAVRRARELMILDKQYREFTPEYDATEEEHQAVLKIMQKLREKSPKSNWYPWCKNFLELVRSAPPSLNGKLGLYVKHLIGRVSNKGSKLPDGSSSIQIHLLSGKVRVIEDVSLDTYIMTVKQKYQEASDKRTKGRWYSDRAVFLYFGCKLTDDMQLRDVFKCFPKTAVKNKESYKLNLVYHCLQCEREPEFENNGDDSVSLNEADIKSAKSSARFRRAVGVLKEALMKGAPEERMRISGMQTQTKEQQSKETPPVQQAGASASQSHASSSSSNASSSSSSVSSSTSATP